MNKLSAQIREKTGGQDAKSLRAQGFVPAIIYGEGMDPISLAINYADVRGMAHSEHGFHALIDLVIKDGGKERHENVMVKEIQRHPTRDTYEHIDFMKVNLNKVIKTKVALSIIGEAAGLQEGGVLQQIHREVEVECLPTALRDSIEVDVTDMVIGSTLTVADLVIPEGITILTSPEETIMTITAPSAEVEEVVEVEAEEAEPELVGSEKPAEESKE